MSENDRTKIYICKAKIEKHLLFKESQISQVIHRFSLIYAEKCITMWIKSGNPQTYPQNLGDIYSKTVDKVYIL